MRLYSYHRVKKKSIFRLRLLAWLLLGAGLSSPITVAGKLPSDPLVDQWSYRDVKTFAAWDYATGSPDVVVAVIDNGFDNWHPELEPNVWENDKEIAGNDMDDDHNGYVDDVWGWNFVDNNNDPRPSVFELYHGEKPDTAIHHGTVVAGIIGAVGDNNSLGAGINWRVKLMNLKVVGNSGNIEGARIAEAIHYAVDNGAAIINVSLIGPQEQAIKDAIHYAFEHRVAVIAAAGNDYFSLDENPRYPICADNGESEQRVLGVSAIDETHHLAQFSNIGKCIDITAPGVHVSSTMRYAPEYGLDKLYGGPFNGTSFAAPFVSGAAALLKGLHPEWGPKEIYHLLLSTVHKTPPKDELSYSLAFGAGLLQIDAAVKAAFATLSGAHRLTRLIALSPPSGLMSALSIDDGAQFSNPATIAELKGMQSVAQFHSNNEVKYAAVFPKRKRQSEVRVFDGDWKQLSAWTVPFDGSVGITFARLWGDAEPSIVLAPAITSAVVFRIYDQVGHEIHTFTIPNKHTGVAITTTDVGQKQDLVAVYKEAGKSILHRFNSATTTDQTIDVSAMSTVGAVASADLYGDGRQDYVVAAGAKAEPFLAYYAPNGTLQRKFYAYSPEYRGGMSLTSGDFDGDGKDDVIVVPFTGTQPVRVWTGQSKAITDWRPFGDRSRERAVILADYKS